MAPIQDEIQACPPCPIPALIDRGHMQIKVGSDLWKYIGVSAISVLLTAVAFWLTWPSQMQAEVNSKMSRTEVVEYIRTYSPYALDRSFVTQTLTRQEEWQGKMDEKIQGMDMRLQRLETLLQTRIGK